LRLKAKEKRREGKIHCGDAKDAKKKNREI